MNQLSACPSCQRHVRVSESACPFCRASLDETFRATPPARRPLARLSRAALFTLATSGGIASGVIACGDEMTEALYGGPPLDAGPDADSGQAHAVYGGPALDGSLPDGTLQPAYGGPPPRLDAGDDSGH